MNFGTMNTGDCQPLQCDKAMNCIEGVRNPVATPLEMGNLRSQLIDCPPCLQAFDMEVKLKTMNGNAMAANNIAVAGEVQTRKPL